MHAFPREKTALVGVDPHDLAVEEGTFRSRVFSLASLRGKRRLHALEPHAEAVLRAEIVAEGSEVFLHRDEEVGLVARQPPRDHERIAERFVPLGRIDGDLDVVLLERVVVGLDENAEPGRRKGEARDIQARGQAQG